MQCIAFPVGEKKVFNVWMQDVRESNLALLNNVDTDYYMFLSETFREALEGDSKRKAALALRTAYHQGLETMFTFLGCIVQAPKAPVAWIPNCTTNDLRSVVTAIDDHSVSVMVHKSIEEFSWKGLSALVHRPMGVPENAPDPVTYFARLWAVFAKEYLNQSYQKEYNSLKHGFRVTYGGFAKVSWKAKDGTEQVFSGGEDGAGFYATKRIEDAPKEQHVLYRRGVNWDPEKIANRLELISLSIKNIVQFLKICSGYTGEVSMQYLMDDDNLQNVLDHKTTLLSAEFTPPVHMHTSKEALSRNAILADLETSYKPSGKAVEVE